MIGVLDLGSRSRASGGSFSSSSSSGRGGRCGCCDFFHPAGKCLVLDQQQKGGALLIAKEHQRLLGENDGAVRLWALPVASIFGLAAFFCTAALKPLNLIWFKFGLLLHKIVNPIIMGLMFYLTIMPIGLIMRISGKDILNLKIDKTASTYWITRESPERDSLKNQF